MENFTDYLLEEAKKESDKPIKLKEPIVFNTYTLEVVPYSQYQPKCDPDKVWNEEVGGYKLGDSCGNEIYTKDRTQCAIYYDKTQLLMFKKSIDVIEDPLRYIRRLADEKFLEIWDDPDEKEVIEQLTETLKHLATEIERFDLLVK